jgi:Na+/H+ antiporter NhaC
MFNKILDLCTEYPFAFYCVGMAVVALIAYATGLDCEKSPVTCLMMVSK